jgi:hypothetical protein
MNGWGLVEIARRLVLASAIAAMAVLAYWTGFEPTIRVSPAPVEMTPEAQKSEGISAHSEGSLLAKPREPGYDGVVIVNGPAWEGVFEGITRTFSQDFPIAGWEHRIQKRDLKRAREEKRRSADLRYGGSFRSLYFLARETPFDGVVANWKPYARYLLKCPEAPGVALQAAYSPTYRLVGFFDVITLPETFAYPYRSAALWVGLIGLAIYVLLPWRRGKADVVAYRRWRVILGDGAASLLLFGFFFALPIAVIGGSEEAVRDYLPFTVVPWLIACLGLVALYWCAWTAAYRLEISSEGLGIESIWGRVAYGYSHIKTVQPVRLRPPKWLIVLTWASVFLGRSAAATAGQTGRALILSSSVANGLRLDLGNGKRVYLWYSDQLGNTAVSSFTRLGEALHREGIDWADSVTEIRAVFPPNH